MKRVTIKGQPGKTGFLWGAGVGFIAFLFLGALRGIVYGGFWGLVIAGYLFGTPVEPTLMNKAIVALGMMLGVGASFVFFTGAGALLGLGFGILYPLCEKLIQQVNRVYRRTRGALRELKGSNPIAPFSEEDSFVRRGRAAGAVLGAAGFAAGGLVTGVLYGGAGGLIFASSFYGAPVPQALLPKLMVGAGMLLGALSVGAFLLVVGAVLGTLAGYGLRVAHRVVSRMVKRPTPVEITHSR
ncbi:MAG: hypothetical protein HYY65_03515 [Candidatus Tectomicrobia bacterium]|uniref:Uncharacterized protein n=1 Tax=Tectimicrobiota bacterium TaxID=2528274 RepID=A0A932LZD2_UNCTE|nr:hypothetical protein [Candidatus Tectomicrobia bacterium]